jgi:hypothetical protein
MEGEQRGERTKRSETARTSTKRSALVPYPLDAHKKNQIDAFRVHTPSSRSMRQRGVGCRPRGEACGLHRQVECVCRQGGTDVSQSPVKRWNGYMWAENEQNRADSSRRARRAIVFLRCMPPLPHLHLPLTLLASILSALCSASADSLVSIHPQALAPSSGPHSPWLHKDQIGTPDALGALNRIISGGGCKLRVCPCCALFSFSLSLLGSDELAILLLLLFPLLNHILCLSYALKVTGETKGEERCLSIDTFSQHILPQFSLI